MRLLFLDQFSDLGGAQQVLLELLPAVRERGWSALVGMPGEGEMFGRVKALGVETARIDCGPYRSGRKSLADVARLVSETPRLAKQIETLAKGADAVYCNGPRVLPGAAMATIEAPVFFHSHSFVPPGASRRLAGMALRSRRARVIGACRFVADPWREYVGDSRVSVIYNGVRGDGREAGRDGFTVACIGRIAPEKGQKEFLRATARIRDRVPGARFVIYGAPLFSGSQYEADVRAQAVGLPVEFAGWVSDVYAALSTVSLLLVPSAAHEATTRVILEAFAAGVPVIAFRSGGIPEVVEHGVDGFLAESAEEMAKIAVELLGDPARRAAAARAGYKTWQRRFTQERFQSQVLDYLSQNVRRSAS